MSDQVKQTEQEPAPNHQIWIESEVEDFPYEQRLKECLTCALAQEGMAFDCEINILITNDEGIHQINLETRQVDSPTDVLSFPMFELVPGVPVDESDNENADRFELDETDTLPLGDMVISYERAVAQAADYGHSVEREVCYLAVHSLLHLLGYDHMDGDDGPQKRQMRAREEAIMNTLGVTRA
jgi:probable rRNA maturation factor